MLTVTIVTRLGTLVSIAQNLEIFLKMLIPLLRNIPIVLKKFLFELCKQLDLEDDSSNQDKE